MEQSRRAVESYWRSRMIDGVTSDEDKVTPVYKLDEVCDLLRSSHVSIVKEVSEFILKRLDHKSPIVKQKALRVIKYAVGKSGAEFKREMQRNSVAVRQLIHYKGHPDPLKGDALNKFVRETAQETLSVLFSSEDSKAPPTESSLRSRIQGFGNTNYEMPSEDRKSFISEVVDIGSATIKQGLSSLAQSPSLKRSSDSGSYRSPNLRGSLTADSDCSNRYEGIRSTAETYNSSRFSNNAGSRSWGQHPSEPELETGNKDSGSTYNQKSREEKLLETIVTASGVRLQPTRDALNVFLVEASKLNALSLGHAIEAKLRSPSWQVRMKAMCVLEAVLRKKEDDHFSDIVSYFSDNKDVVVSCSESPQASLREKATKVLSLLGGEHIGGVHHEAKSRKISQPSIIPDLIDTGEDTLEDFRKAEVEPKITNVTSTAPLINDLLGDDFGGIRDSTNTHKLEDDPFADVSFHVNQAKDHAADIFSGLPVDISSSAETHSVVYQMESGNHGTFDLSRSRPELAKEHSNLVKDATNLMDGLLLNGNDPFSKHNGRDSEKHGNIAGSVSIVNQDNTKSNDVLISGIASQGMNANPMFPVGAMAYNLPPGVMFNPAAFTSQPMNYSDMGTLFAQQQQFLTTLSNFQQLGSLQSNKSMNAGGSRVGNSSPLPDIFNPVIATEPPASLMNGSKKEDTRAFDFISDHVASARDRKHMV
ncbi:VHS domain-containing protein [Striga asiatica]|uniref:VHS domain-containing protein n=1 Tax=Striga asiatica TaxID=4170 RepID=A0A5A7QMS7_STRAF|nr:VHS domain-containing protein [Striga asiatica]